MASGLRRGGVCASMGLLGLAMIVTAPARGLAQGTWTSTLLPRDLDGDSTNGPEAFYDETLGLTWLRDASASGLVTWWEANDWVAQLDVGGVRGWRMPRIHDPGRGGCRWGNQGTDCGYNPRTRVAGITYSEMGHLWYSTLGNLAFFDPSGRKQPAGWGLKQVAAFVGLRAYGYWTSVEYAPDRALAWFFGMAGGGQDRIDKHNVAYVLAVHDGDVGRPLK